MLSRVSLPLLLPSLGLPMLGQLSLPDPESPESIGWLLLTLFALIGMANQGLDLWRKLFPKETPPANTVYATKAELNQARLDADADLKRIEREHETALQRIEQRFVHWLEQVDENQKHEAAMLNSWRDGLQKWKEDMERAVGRIETKADLVMLKASQTKQR